MSGRAVARLPWSDLTCCMVLFTRPPAGGAGGSERLTGHVPERMRRGVDGRARSGGWVGEGDSYKSGRPKRFFNRSNFRSFSEFTISLPKMIDICSAII